MTLSPFYSNLLQNESVLVSSIALIVSLVALASTVISRKYQRLEDIIEVGQELDLEFANTIGDIDDRSNLTASEEQKVQLLLRERYMHMEYVSFLINRGRIAEEHGYKLTSNHLDTLMAQQEKLKDKVPINEDDYPETYKLHRRWKDKEAEDFQTLYTRIRLKIHEFRRSLMQKDNRKILYLLLGVLIGFLIGYVIPSLLL